MNNGNVAFLKAVGWMIGVNLVINLLPYPWGFIAFLALIAGAVYEIYRQTRY